MLDGDHQREWKRGRGAPEPRGVHRPQPARGEDPQGLREHAWRNLLRVRDAESPRIPSVVDRTRPVAAGAPVVAVHFLGRRGGVRARRGSAAVCRENGARAARRGARRRHPGGLPATARASSPAATTARSSRPTRTARARRSRPTPSTAGSIASRSGRTASVAWSGRQAGVRAQRQGRDQIARSAVEHRRARLRAERPAARGRALRRRVALVSQRAGRARDARLEGLAPRRAVQPGRQVPRHRHAGGDAARLAPDGRARTCACRAIRRKVRSMAFTPGGKWLATSGSEQLILWPFASKDGPMGKQPRMVAPYDKRAVAVACHPEAGGRRRRLRGRPRACSAASTTARRFWRRGRASVPVSALAWSADGSRLAFGTEDGEAGIVDLA